MATPPATRRTFGTAEVLGIWMLGPLPFLVFTAVVIWATWPAVSWTGDAGLLIGLLGFAVLASNVYGFVAAIVLLALEGCRPRLPESWLLLAYEVLWVAALAIVLGDVRGSVDALLWPVAAAMAALALAIPVVAVSRWVERRR